MNKFPLFPPNFQEREMGGFFFLFKFRKKKRARSLRSLAQRGGISHLGSKRVKGQGQKGPGVIIACGPRAL